MKYLPTVSILVRFEKHIIWNHFTWSNPDRPIHWGWGRVCISEDLKCWEAPALSQVHLGGQTPVDVKQTELLPGDQGVTSVLKNFLRESGVLPLSPSCSLCLQASKGRSCNLACGWVWKGLSALWGRSRLRWGIWQFAEQWGSCLLSVQVAAGLLSREQAPDMLLSEWGCRGKLTVPWLNG